MKKQILHYSILVLSGILFTACGSNSKYDADDLAPGDTAFSIVYDSTSEVGNDKMVDHFHVHAVDDAGKAMPGLKLDLALINGVREINGNKLQRGTGNILATSPISFNDYGVDFSQYGITKTGDSLIILPSAGKTSLTYLGDWRITEIGQALTLQENSFHLESTENLTYIIGHEERLLGGKNGDRGILTVAHIQNIDTNGTSVTDKNGYTYFDVVYDPILAGHTVTIGVHTARSNRFGVSKVVFLRGAEYSASDITIQNRGGTVTVPMTLSISTKNGATEHLIDVRVSSSSFTVDPLDSCQLNVAESDFHTDSGGRVRLVINTKGVVETKDGNTTKTTGSDTCTIKWEGGHSSLYLEY